MFTRYEVITIDDDITLTAFDMMRDAVEYADSLEESVVVYRERYEREEVYSTNK